MCVGAHNFKVFICEEVLKYKKSLRLFISVSKNKDELSLKLYYVMFTEP